MIGASGASSSGVGSLGARASDCNSMAIGPGACAENCALAMGPNVCAMENFAKVKPGQKMPGSN